MILIIFTEQTGFFTVRYIKRINFLAFRTTAGSFREIEEDVENKELLALSRQVNE